MHFKVKDNVSEIEAITSHHLFLKTQRLRYSILFARNDGLFCESLFFIQICGYELICSEIGKLI